MPQKEISQGKLVRDLASYSDVDLRSITDTNQKTFWASVKIFLYNPKNGTCCGRTSAQWIRMLFYYIGYTIFIILLFLAFLYGSVAIIKSLYPNHPVIDKEILLENAHPGLGFVPNIVVTKHPIIWFSSEQSEGKTEEEYIKALNKFFLKYRKAKQENYSDCSSGNKGTKPCYFDLNWLKECSATRYFYSNSSLCFFLKLNRRRHWIPSYFKNEEDLPDEMSSSMMDHILTSSNKDLIYVECLGENLWDNEHMGEITYYPKPGFDGYYFPYNGENEYLAPLVAVKMSGVTTGIVIHIECTVWAKNIGPKLNNVHLKVFIDNTLNY